MITVDLVAMAVCALCALVAIVYASSSRTHDVDECARRAAALMRREAEQHAADPASATRPLRSVHLCEREEQLAGSIRRHPAGSKL